MGVDFMLPVHISNYFGELSHSSERAIPLVPRLSFL